MKAKLYNHKGEGISDIELNSKIFGLAINPNLIYQVYNALLSNRRKSVAHAKDRSEVSGGGRKPWKQKGTGRARHGSTRSPIWKGGGVTFGPNKNRNYSVRINKKAKQKALKMVLSSKLKDNELKIIQDFGADIKKTGDMGKITRLLVGQAKPSTAVLLISPEEKNAIRFSRNIPYLETITTNSVDIINILDRKYLIITESGLEKLISHFI